jgi:hypothetical protein
VPRRMQIRHVAKKRSRNGPADEWRYTFNFS